MIKNTLILIAFILFNYKAYSQTNLVPNPSFEIYDTCPNTLSQISRAVGWHSARPSPDYFNSCSSSSLSSVPFNYWGYQYSASGNGYAGFDAKDQQFLVREYLQSQLTNTLQIGVVYYLSFKVCLAYANFNQNAYCSINKIGALFSTISYSDTNNAPVCNCAQVYTSSIITDTSNWIIIKGSFIADSNYTYISIGNFFTNALTDSVQVVGTECVSYYYVDDICLSDDSTYCPTYIFTTEIDKNKKENVSCFPNPAKEFIVIKSDEYIEEIKLYNMMGQLLRSYAGNSLQEYNLRACLNLC